MREIPRRPLIPRLKRINGRELRRLLRMYGFERIKQRGKGSHEIWRNGEGKEVVVAVRAGEVVPVGTLKKILRNAGIPEKALRR